MNFPRLIYAANRKIGFECLQILLEFNWKPIALLIPSPDKAECTDEMIKILDKVPVIRGKVFREPQGIQLLRSLEPDYILSVHFPYIIPAEVLKIPSIGILNLHPAYLPYNRGWHTPTWSILEGTPFGATLHWVDEGIDTGPIALRQQIEVLPSDTAHTLYQRVLELEKKLFREALPLLAARALPRIPQESGGTTHHKEDIKQVQHLELERQMTVKEFLNLLRALTTNRWSESAYFLVDGVKYRVRIEIKKDEDNG